MPLEDGAAGAAGRIPQADGAIAAATGQAAIGKGHQRSHRTPHRQGAQKGFRGQKAGVPGARGASHLQPLFHLLPQALQWAVIRQPRQQLGGQVLLSVPAFLVAEHMGGLAQGAAQALQLRREAGLSIGGRIEIAEEGVETRQPQAGLEPGELAQLPGDHLRPLVIAEMAGQVAHQVGAGVGAVGRHFSQGPGAELLSGYLAIHPEAAGSRLVVDLFTQPLLERQVIETAEHIAAIGTLHRCQVDQSQQILQWLQRRRNIAHAQAKDRRQRLESQRFPLLAQQGQDRLHGRIAGLLREPSLKGGLVEAIHAGRQGVEALAVFEGEGAAGQVVEHPHGVEKLAAALVLQHRGGFAGAEASAAEDRGQGLLLTASLHIGVDVGQVLRFLGVDLLDREEALPQRFEHLIAAAARGQNPQPGGQIACFLRQQLHDRGPGAVAAAWAVVERFIEGIDHQEKLGGWCLDAPQRRQHRLVKGGQGFLVGLIECLPQFLGVVRLQQGAISGQSIGQLAGQAAHKAARLQGVADVGSAEVVSHHGQSGCACVEQLRQERRFTNAIVGADQQGLLALGVGGPSAHLLKQPFPSHETLPFLRAIGGEVPCLGPAPVAAAYGLLVVGDGGSQVADRGLLTEGGCGVVGGLVEGIGGQAGQARVASGQVHNGANKLSRHGWIPAAQQLAEAVGGKWFNRQLTDPPGVWGVAAAEGDQADAALGALQGIAQGFQQLGWGVVGHDDKPHAFF